MYPRASKFRLRSKKKTKKYNKLSNKTIYLLSILNKIKINRRITLEITVYFQIVSV